MGTHTCACTHAHTHTHTHQRPRAHTHSLALIQHMDILSHCTSPPSFFPSTVNLPTDTIIVIVVGLVALLLYLLIIIIILCTCAQCCRARLRKKHTEVLQMEAEVLRANRKTQDVKDNSAILRQTPAFTSAIATTSFAIPPSPSPSGSRRTETVVSVDAPMAYSIPTPRSSVPTTVTEPIQLPNFSRRNLKVGS